MHGMDIDVFTGGLFDTNCFFLRAPGILVDAPQETADWLSAKGYRVRTLLLTHGHIDHTWDAARIQREHGCRLGCHAECVPMVEDPDFFLRLGFNWQIETLHPDVILAETPAMSIEGTDFQLLDLPGHCPGSLGFLWLAEQALFGGDVLMAGGCGRTDLPGGSTELLIQSVREKLWTLDDAVRVLPGHGPATTIGQERRTNPCVGEAALRNLA
jgi:hydroxyacylglutathione hydrolase